MKRQNETPVCLAAAGGCLGSFPALSLLGLRFDWLLLIMINNPLLIKGGGTRREAGGTVGSLC